MREGSLDAPTAVHPIAWQDPAFYDPESIDKELERVFDICHGCRRCFNLCDSFPRLFDLVDAAPTQELDSVDHKDFKSVVDACTLCDMCYMTKCPYVPPHEFNLDFPQSDACVTVPWSKSRARWRSPTSNWRRRTETASSPGSSHRSRTGPPSAATRLSGRCCAMRPGCIRTPELPTYASQKLVNQAGRDAGPEPRRSRVRP